MVMNMFKRLIAIIAVLSVAVLTAQSGAASNLPYYSYTQDLTNDQVIIPAPYRIGRTIKTIKGTVSLNDPQDISYKDDRIYIADTGNNRVIVLDGSFCFLGELNNLAAPSGVFVTEQYVYISDTNNSRIIKANRELKVIEIFEKPEIPILGENYSYLPKKIAVDYSGRIYVVAQGINKGIIQLNKDGTFFNFLGAPKVSYNIFDLFIRSISTEEQLEKMEKYVPTEYNSINIDKNAFIYATSSSTSVTAIAKMNLSGKNILKQPDGVEIQGELLSDIALNDSGMYSTVDIVTGKIYTYDEEGYFLFEFGGNGDSQGLQRSPQAIEYKDDQLLVLDSVGSKLTVYEKTEFCSNIEQALGCYKQGKYDDAYQLFHKVLDASSNFTFAQLGIAKIEIQKGNYKTAMSLLKTIGEKEYYSTAFQEYRKEIFRGVFTYAVIGLLMLAVIIIAVKKIFFKKTRPSYAVHSTLGNQLWYAKHVIFHPFDGFWDMKHEKRGSPKAACILFAVFFIEYALDKTAKGYLFMPSEPSNIFEELFICIITILLWCTANWSLTTLMDGKGKFSDIFTATGYALVPYIITTPFFILISHMITIEESALFYAANYVIYVWVAALLLFGMISIHDYSLSKMLLTTLLTVFGIAIILFLVLVFFNMLQTAYDFFFNIFKELSLRI